MRHEPFEPVEPTGGGLRWTTWAIVTALYVVCVSLATWPRILGFGSDLPSPGDPLQHLWIMRWYRTCLLEGRSMVICPEIQYPVGAPLGTFSPLHFQSLLFIPLSLVIENDILCYNLVWMFGMVFTGLGTFLLIWHDQRDAWCAGLGGMLAMLSGPMLLHATGHLELIGIGGFPLFLWAWLRFVDRPEWRTWGAAVGFYLLLGLISAYFVVFAIFPAALYVVWKSGGLRPRSMVTWLRERAGWFSAFAAVVTTGLLLIFGNQLWAKRHGYIIPRPLAEFRVHGAPLWSYVLPSEKHALGDVLPSGLYETSEVHGNLGECCSYLGMVALGLLLYTAVVRVRFARATFWWAALAVLVVLSGGAAWHVGRFEIPLPAIWLKRNIFLFEQIRAPARFNLLAAVVAALVAAQGLKHLLSRIQVGWMRAAVFTSLAAAAMADLAMVPYGSAPIPPMPGCYAFMKQVAPGAPFVEIPQFGSGGSFLYAACGYWQSHHRGRTNAGYCGQGNVLFDNLLTYNSPFDATRLARPDYLAGSDRISFDMTGEVSFLDYAWLYLQAHDYRFVVLHQWPGSVSHLPVRLDRVKVLLDVAKVYEDAATVVYDRDRLPLPTHPVLLTLQGWRPAWDGKMMRVANREASLIVYNPDPGHDLQIGMDARAFLQFRHVRLRSGAKELAHWAINPGSYQPLASGTLRLPAGLSTLTLESDGASTPRDWQDASLVGDRSPYSLKVKNLGLEVAPTLARQSPDKPDAGTIDPRR
jgi:hypothetical protein